MRPSVFTLALILAVAALLRFLALGAGIPFNVGVDEPEIMSRVVQMMRTGDFNPHFFDYPGLYFYLQLGVAVLRFLAGATLGQWSALDQVDTADFYLWGRALTAVFGTLTVLLVYRVGMRWGARHAALAAGLMAVMPLHVRESHYVLTDVPVTFFVTLTLLLTLSAHERERAASFAWAGAAAGLAAATKYPGALVLVVPLLAVWMTLGTKPSRLVASLAVLGGAAAAFVVAAPYTILDLPAFLNGYAHLAGYYTPKRLAEPAWLTYYKHLSRSMDWPAFLLLLGGLGLGAVRAVRGPGRVRWTVTIAFPLLYYYFLSGQTLVFGRYLLPLLPFVCVLAAVGTVSGVSLLRRFDIPRAPRTAVIAALTAAALVPPAWQSIGFIRMIARTSTVEQAHTWITSDVPKGSSIIIETQALQLSPRSYKAKNVPQLVMDSRAPADHDAYVKAGIDYVVASSQKYGDALSRPKDFPELYDAYSRLFGQSQEVMRFTPDAQHPGPEIRVFRLR
jgi:4-amino-4-deoxy-L-arabinose transferase-like glycosyltransferase